VNAKNIEKIGFNKDRQESAIYAFTIVTIVFLPLSTVAGILGMNTNDVRNMNINQWVFWAVALPLTFIIITLCLLWSGELEYFWRGFANLWRRGSGRGRGEYMSIRDGYSRVVIRDREQDDYYYRPRERERRDLYGNRSYSYV
jgi:CorA-like Mg2+ transporter protein